MKILFSEPFLRDFRKLPPGIQQATDKTLLRFRNNPRYPSLRTKKLPGSTTIWYGRIDRSYRFTFEYQNDSIILRRVGTHDILTRERK